MVEDPIARYLPKAIESPTFQLPKAPEVISKGSLLERANASIEDFIPTRHKPDLQLISRPWLHCPEDCSQVPMKDINLGTLSSPTQYSFPARLCIPAGRQRHLCRLAGEAAVSKVPPHSIQTAVRLGCRDSGMIPSLLQCFEFIHLIGSLAT
jgi:hypothetical protein